MTFLCCYYYLTHDSYITQLIFIYMVYYIHAHEILAIISYELDDGSSATSRRTKAANTT